MVAYYRRKAAESTTQTSEYDSALTRRFVRALLSFFWTPFQKSKNIFQRLPQISMLILIVYLVLETWKLLVDLILPSVWPAYDKFIGKVESRNLEQRIIWIFLLQVL